MEARWLEQVEADLPAENDWLSTSETVFLQGLRFAKRLADWRLGRWTAKQAVASYLDLPTRPQTLARLEIHPAMTGAPEVFLNQERAPVTISLSHSAGRAVCAVASPGVELGCDLEAIERRSDAFVSDYFTAEEQALLAQASATDRDWLVTLLWSGKESALKALQTGLRLDTRSVIVSVGDELGQNSWNRLQVCYDVNRIFQGWWQRSNAVVRTLVANPSPDAPIPLKVVPEFSAEQAPQCT
jgi:4'-phosphopantetheinyl transferase